MAKGIKFNFSDLTGQLIVAWYKNTAPLAEVGRMVYNPGAGEKTLVPAGVGAGAYTFKFYESSDGVALTTLLTDWSIDGSFLAEDNEITFYDYKVGRGQSGDGWADPEPGSNTLNDTRLAGKAYRLFQPVTGLRPTGSYVVLDAGGFSLPDDETFMRNDTWTAMVVSVTPLAEPAPSYPSVREVDTSEALTAEYHNQHNAAAFAGDIGQTDFPAFNTLPDQETTFSTYTGSQRYWVLQFATGNTVFFRGKARNRITLGKDEQIRIQIKGGLPYVTHYEGDYRRVGQRIWLDDPNEPNCIIRNGSILYKADYPRLYDWVADLNPAWVVDFGTWEADKGLFAIDAINERIRIPDDRGRFIRGLTVWDGGNHDGRLRSVPGGYQTESVNLSGISIEVMDGQGGSNTGTVVGTGLSGQDAVRAWVAGGGLVRLVGPAGNRDETAPGNTGLIPGLMI